MFDNLKDLYQLKKQAEELQKQMANELVTGTSGLITVTMNGNQELVNVEASSNDLVNPEVLAIDFKTAFNVAQSEMKKILAQKFKGMM